jgi:hypothetical protein
MLPWCEQAGCESGQVSKPLAQALFDCLAPSQSSRLIGCFGLATIQVVADRLEGSGHLVGQWCGVGHESSSRAGVDEDTEDERPQPPIQTARLVALPHCISYDGPAPR